MSPATAIVFVVDDDISVRESLELLILSAGWQPETFASAQAVPWPSTSALFQAALYWTFLFQVSMVWNCRSVSQESDPICPSSSSPATAMCP